MNQIIFTEYRYEVALIAAILFYLLCNFHLESLLNRAVRVWSEIISTFCTVTIVGIALFGVITGSSSELVVPFSDNVDWAIIFSGLFIAAFTEGSLVYLGLLLYAVFRLSTPSFELQSASSLLLFCLSISTFNLNKRDWLRATALQKISRLYVLLISGLVISCSIVALMNFDSFFAQTHQLFSDQITWTPNLALVTIMSSISLWFLVITDQVGRSILPVLSIPTAVILYFVFPQDPFVLPVIMGAVLGLMLNPLVFHPKKPKKLPKSTKKSVALSRTY
ncbi:hypothetical protein N9W79_00090 [bacterium]|nr:hypothetical protein [bacterium]